MGESGFVWSVVWVMSAGLVENAFLSEQPRSLKTSLDHVLNASFKDLTVLSLLAFCLMVSTNLFRLSTKISQFSLMSSVLELVA